MKIAYIISMATSGISHWMYREIDILTRNGVEIFAFPLKWTEGANMPHPDWRFRRPSWIRSAAAQPMAFLSHPVQYLKLLMLALRMRTVAEFLLACDFSREIKKVGATHIHCHFGDRKLFTGYYCSRLLNLPLTVTVHAYEIHKNPNPAMFKLAAQRCSRVVVQSFYNRNLVMRNFGVAEDKISIVRAYGDTSDPRRRASIKLMMVGEFREKKGHEILFRAMKKLDRDDITVWIAGRGKLDVRKMAEELGVSHQTVFLGEVNAEVLSALYDACDMVVLPSRTASDGDSEGIPAVLIEAMSHAKPVISTRHAGIPELVEEVLVDQNDVDALAEAIARIADDPKLREEMGERNTQIIRRDFSVSAVLQLKDIFASQSPRFGNPGPVSG